MIPLNLQFGNRALHGQPLSNPAVFTRKDSFADAETIYLPTAANTYSWPRGEAVPRGKTTSRPEKLTKRGRFRNHCSDVANPGLSRGRVTPYFSSPFAAKAAVSVAACTPAQGLGSHRCPPAPAHGADPPAKLRFAARGAERPRELPAAGGCSAQPGDAPHSPGRPRPHLPRRPLPPYLGLRLRQGFSAGPGALRGRDSGEGRVAAGPAPRRP